MTNAGRSYRLLQEIDANRRFLLMAYRQNSALLARTEPRIRRMLEQPSATDIDVGSDKATSRLL